MISCPIRPGAVGLTRHERKDAMDLSTLTYGAPATEPAPIEPIRVDGMAYAKIIDGMMNVGYFRERPTADGGSERVIVAKLVFPGDPSTVNRALVVTQAGLDGAMREQVEREQAERRARPKPLSSPRCGPARHRGERSGNERRLGQFAPALHDRRIGQARFHPAPSPARPYSSAGQFPQGALDPPQRASTTRDKSSDLTSVTAPSTASSPPSDIRT